MATSKKDFWPPRGCPECGGPLDIYAVTNRKCGRGGCSEIDTVIHQPQERRTSAIFSDCTRYRYSLTRLWTDNGDDPVRLIHFVMLNPSTADDIDNDPTVERCERRALMLGYDGLIVTNIFAWRSTDPNVLAAIDENPVGQENDEHILTSAIAARKTVCAWGNHGKLNGRGAEVEQMLRSAGIQIYHLRLTKSGMPEHPLYLKYSLKPQMWKRESKNKDTRI